MSTPSTLTIALPDGIVEPQTSEATRELTTISSAILVSLGVVSLTPDFFTRRDALIAKATACAEVVTPEGETAAAAAMKALRAFESENEKMGLALRGPLTAASKRIKQIEDDGLAPATKAKDRLRSMLDARAAEKIAEQRRQEVEAAAAAKKIEDDRIAAEKAAAKLAEDQAKAEAAAAKAKRDAEDARQAAEHSQKPEVIAAAREAQKQAEEAQAKAQKEAEALAQKVADAAFEASMAELAPAPAAAAPVEFTGSYKAKMVRDFEVLDHADAYKAARNLERFAAFAFANPTLNLSRFLKIEIRRADLLDALKNEDFLKDTKPPGIRIYERVASTNR